MVRGGGGGKEAVPHPVEETAYSLFVVFVVVFIVVVMMVFRGRGDGNRRGSIDERTIDDPSNIVREK